MKKGNFSSSSKQMQSFNMSETSLAQVQIGTLKLQKEFIIIFKLSIVF